MSKTNPLNASIDLGSSRFLVAAARQHGSSFEIAGIGSALAYGVEHGMLTNIAAASNALRSAIREAEISAEDSITGDVITGVSGDHLQGEDKRAPVKIQGGAVTAGDIDLALDTLQAFPIDQSRDFLHVLQQSFTIDQRDGIKQPLGMTGSLLEAEAHIVTAQKNALANLYSCLREAGIRSKKLAATALASSVAATTTDEREMGVVSINLGAGTSELTMFKQGSLRKLVSIPMGNNLIDRDIAKTFRISVAESERIKREIGSAVQVPYSTEHVMEVTSTDGSDTTKIDAHILSMTIEARVEEMLTALRSQLESWNTSNELGAGIVVTGGGAKLKDLLELAHEILGLPVRLGAPTYAGPHHEEVAGPDFSSVLGLLTLQAQNFIPEVTQASNPNVGIFRRLLGAFAPRRHVH